MIKYKPKERNPDPIFQFGSKLATVALEIVAFLPSSRENQLLVMPQLIHDLTGFLLGSNKRHSADINHQTSFKQDFHVQ